MVTMMKEKRLIRVTFSRTGVHNDDNGDDDGDGDGDDDDHGDDDSGSCCVDKNTGKGGH